MIGGFIGVASGAETWGTAWGFDTHSTVPLPMGAAQLVLAWLAARDGRPRVGFVAAVLLSTICLLSVLFGLFDGDLIGNVAPDGLLAWGFAWMVPLLCSTVVVGVLAFVRARQLRHLRRRTGEEARGPGSVVGSATVMPQAQSGWDAWAPWRLSDAADSPGDGIRKESQRDPPETSTGRSWSRGSCRRVH